MVAIPCNDVMAWSQKPWRLSPPTSSFLPRLLPTYVLSPCIYSNSFNLNAPRLRRSALGVVAEEKAGGQSSSDFKLTFLEVNGWLWEVDGVKLLVDPILVGNLDFGVPWLYDGAKKFLNNFQ